MAVILGAYTIAWAGPGANFGVFVGFSTIIEFPALVVNGVLFLGQLFAGQQSFWRATAGGVAGGLTWAGLSRALCSCPCSPPCLAVIVTSPNGLMNGKTEGGFDGATWADAHCETSIPPWI